MTRIVAGQFGGRRLRVPPSGTRPTSDRVREAMFSAVQARMDLDGAAVLDLYAGSGALGLEALSRGADHVVLVESDTKAAAVARANAAELGSTGVAVRQSTVAGALVGAADREYDLVLADPPYAVGEDEVRAVLDALVAGGWVGEGSLVILERSSRSPDTPWPDGFSAPKVKRYGETRLEYGTCYGRQP
ncbi:16S rRNA (guanine(966)-N(2))-methyltransferase RsmD [Rhodococcus sp. D2-41]|uniref:16S rRNA (guanine(966)-N(2))-methyltransferase RsmD n=1 Tax=Speluncibacter jeojiensis TaxID=2710754 RepID=UPI00240F18CE|nr:16S rRNA (guanine(966)-N(2))-methyltransferase RsmD [Rhodococcus sp. D2-41]MDG3011058.1 16S rRNA (guanine(966)-N(2))-methyltransferase RsmD [Rhodococcus sp. D2-41]